ncbi:enoyl-[acyl-carrier-protein] reductase FabK [Natranaerobius thermophilus]|uniref:Probable nitronate monooxygenase n=1 Tax=Natranaerobius thermophilus (strain ATCC BAA-1301 / DSM 18059 / JW/NM-WN-LF) TaxID=457570 RepID=B2A2M6_NATTJ|nr:enoyl-[acyl-carrier-protein] reductase FabK [Natranaerobius thermophilus]ACB84941.1 enoyl-(acyl-carrier-protein) reductase II [Natranaerobius thermophilus JW/NM-WN-LF]
MNTKQLLQLLDIDYPIIQGGMAWVATGELAAAVSEAGGLGMIGAGNAPVDVVEKEINKVKAKTDNPFGVNIMLLSPFVDEIVDLVIQKQVPVVTTGAGNPGKYMDKFKEAGIKVIPVVPSVALAKRMERQKVDAVIAEGTEAGGHIGELTTMALVPQIVNSINLPVIAAGGIGDGRGLVAALALGASGVQMGTRFVMCHECTAHDNYKQAIKKAKDRDTLVTARSTGHPVRTIKNKLTKKFTKMEQQGVPKEKIEELGAGMLSKAVNEGDVEEGSVMAGQISGLVSQEQSAREIIEEVMTEAKNLVDSFDSKNLER